MIIVQKKKQKIDGFDAGPAKNIVFDSTIDRCHDKVSRTALNKPVSDSCCHSVGFFFFSSYGLICLYFVYTCLMRICNKTNAQRVNTNNSIEWNVVNVHFNAICCWCIQFRDSFFIFVFSSRILLTGWILHFSLAHK